VGSAHDVMDVGIMREEMKDGGGNVKSDVEVVREE
jgi:hypothetical protein